MTNKITHKVYGDIEIDFYPNSHRYKLKGEKSYLTSVTAITGVLDKSRALMKWAVNLTADYLRDWVMENPLEEMNLLAAITTAKQRYTVKRDEAANFGSMVHDFAESFAKHKQGKQDAPEIDSQAPLEVINGINAFLDWVNNNEIEFIEAERLVYSKKHKYVGLVDLIGRINGKLYLIDYKTSSGIYNDMYYQTSGYREAYDEEMEYLGGEKIQGTIIAQFDKGDGSFHVKEVSNKLHKIAYQAFLGAKKLKFKDKEFYKLIKAS